MVVMHIRKFFDCCIQLIICVVVMLVYQIIFQRVEISFHRCIVIRIPRFTHTLCYTKWFTVFCEFSGCVLTPLVAMQHQIAGLHSRLGFDGLLKCPFCQVSSDVFVCYACYNASIVEIDDRTVVALTSVCQKKVCEIGTPFLISFGCCEVLVQFVLINFMCLSTSIVWLSPTRNRVKLHFPIHIFVDSQTAYGRSLPAQIGLHRSITINAAMWMINISNGSLDALFPLVVFGFSIFQKIVIGVGTNAKFS